MIEDEKKEETEVTPEGAVEVNEEDLDKASGGAIYMKPAETSVKPTYDLSPSTPVLGDGSVKPTDQNWDMKKI